MQNVRADQESTRADQESIVIRYGYPSLGGEDVEALAELSAAICDYLTSETDATRPSFHATTLTHRVASHIEQARAEGKAEADAEVQRWQDRMWATVNERAVWEHDLGKHAGDLPFMSCPSCEREVLAARLDNQRAALADLITRHEAHDGRVPASQIRAVLGMPARDRGER